MSDPLWDAVVGIPIDVWIEATTSERFHRILWLRDHPPAEPDFTSIHGKPEQIECITVGSRTVARIPGRDPAAQARHDWQTHGRWER